jgi:hypothetical protein
MKIFSVDRGEIPPLEMPARFRTEIVYFTTPPGKTGTPPLGPNEYWICRDEAARWLDEMVVYVVSPLDSASRAEIELSEYQEAFLLWLIANDTQHVRVVS